MNQNTNKRIIVISIIYIALIGSIIAFLMVPSITKLKENKVKINTKQSELDKATERLSALQKMDKNKEEIEKTVSVIEQYLPDTVSSSSFIVEIEGLAKTLNTVIDSFSMTDGATPTAKKDDKKKEALSQNDFSITAKSAYTQSVEFLSQLENLSRFNTISMIGINSLQGGEISLKLTGQIYYGNK